jgi:hypothetical protein
MEELFGGREKFWGEMKERTGLSIKVLQLGERKRGEHGAHFLWVFFFNESTNFLCMSITSALSPNIHCNTKQTIIYLFIILTDVASATLVPDQSERVPWENLPDP